MSEETPDFDCLNFEMLKLTYSDAQVRYRLARSLEYSGDLAGAVGELQYLFSPKGQRRGFAIYVWRPEDKEARKVGHICWLRGAMS